MSIYATLAASLIFGVHDRVWTVLADPKIIQKDIFHVPLGQQPAVQVVNLPLLPSRLLPGVLAEKDLETLIRKRMNPRDQFLESLTPEEKALIKLMQEHPYAGNQDLAGYLNKSRKTIENQLLGIYDKLQNHFDVDVSYQRKRQMLIDVLAGRI